MKIKERVNIYAHCFFKTMTLRQIQQFNSSQMKVMKYTHALFNDVKLIIKSTIIDKITIVLKFVMSFCLKITNVINRINHLRVLICTLNNTTINNLIEHFNQKLQTQKKIQFAIVIKLHSIIIKKNVQTAIFKKSFFESTSILELINNSDTEIELLLLHVATIIQKIFKKFYICRHKMTNKKYILHN